VDQLPVTTCTAVYQRDVEPQAHGFVFSFDAVAHKDIQWPGISTQEQICGVAEGHPRSMIPPDKYSLRQYLVDELDPELRRLLHLIRYQDRPLRNPESMDRKSNVPYLNRKG
jgi:hypothetical protein